MKISFEKEALLSALIPSAAIAPNKNTNYILECVLFEYPSDVEGKCRLTAYDMEKGMRTTLPARIGEPGKCILNAQSMLQIARSLRDGNITIEGKNVEIKAGNEVKITSGLNVKNAYDLQKPEVPFTFFAGAASGVIGAVGDLIPQAIDLSLFRHLIERVLPPISGALQIKSYRFVLIDSGLKDFAAKEIKANNSKYAHLKKWQGFKKGDFQKGKNKNKAVKTKSKPCRLNPCIYSGFKNYHIKT